MAKAALEMRYPPEELNIDSKKEWYQSFGSGLEDNPKTVAGLVTFGAAASGGLMTLSAIGLVVPSIVKGGAIVKP